MPKAYLTRSELADELSIGASTVDDFVRRGILPPPARISTGCVRWRWETVDQALLSLTGVAGNDQPPPAAEGIRRAIEEAKGGRRGRAA